MEENQSPSRSLIVGSGIQDHDEFVDLCKSKLQSWERKSTVERKGAVYQGGETRVFAETPSTNISLAFESVPWTHED
jgi:predicted Zn-dependent peptidase